MATGRQTVLRAAALSVVAASLVGISGQAVADDPHAQHRSMMARQQAVSKSLSRFEAPQVVGVDSAGQAVSIPELLESDDPVIFNFIFTSCQTICPILSATFAQAQNKLAELPGKPRLISFTIDPEYDTPARLAAYADKFHANSDWLFVTGDASAMVAIQKAYDAFRGDKLNHIALTYMRVDKTKPWVRYEGFLSASDLVAEYSELGSATSD